jgi:diguanylate cyclase (GGDEF)-like protein
MALIAPGILCVFGLFFLWAWALEKKRHYLLGLAAAPCLFALGVLVQVFGWPPATQPNAIVSGLFYTTAVLLAAEGTLRRSHQCFGLALDLSILAAIMGGLWYFAYVTPNLLVRVYIQNFGYGFILLAAALYLTPLMRRRLMDRILFWTLLVFAVHFFPRTVLTIGTHAPTSVPAFAASLFWNALQLSLAVLGAALAAALLAAVLSDVIDDLRHERDVDWLTGVLNRRAFEGRAEAILAQDWRSPCAVVACDLDGFKQINDRHGHAAGDNVLTTFGELLRRTARTADAVGRLGGEEFAVLLPGSTSDGAYLFAERLRVGLLGTRFPFLPAPERITASFGIAEHQPGETYHQLLARADNRLYQAKAAGRNRTIAADGNIVPPQPKPA